MQHFKKIEELRACHIRQAELEGELKAFIKEQLTRVRTLNDGDKVEVFTESGRSLGIGFVDSAYLSIELQSYYVKKYAEDQDRWEIDLNSVVYRINKCKKDGTKSSFRLASALDKKAKFQNYCIPVNKQ